MRSILIAIIMITGLAFAVWTREAHSQTSDVPAWAKAYHNCGTFGATADDCDYPKNGGLYALCDAEGSAPCNTLALMLKDVCEDTVRTYGDGSDRFSCAVVDDATRDAYMRSVNPDVRERTVQAWREGR
jgi:hypothetical protein